MATDIVLKNVILSYPHLITPWAGKPNQTPTYNCAMIIPKDWPHWSELQEAVNNAIMNKWGATPPSSLKLPWLTRYLQPALVKEGPYVGCYVINAKQDPQYGKPKLYDQQVKEIPDIRVAELLFAGAIVHVYVNFYGYSTSGNEGVGTGLKMVQLVNNADVIRLGDAGKAADEVFEAVPGAPPATAPMPGAVQAPWE